MISYVTSVVLPAKSAQSHQILSTARGLKAFLGDGFELICPTRGSGKIEELNHRSVPLRNLSGRRKYIEFLWFLVGMGLDNKNVYTRDILVAALFFIKGKTVVYEAHQTPSIYVKTIVCLLSRSKRFRIACISEALVEYYSTSLRVRSSLITLVRSGVDVELFDSTDAINLRTNFSISEDFVLVHTGSISMERGSALFSSILKQEPSLHILHIGGSESDVQSLRKLVASKRLTACSHVDSRLLPGIQKGADALLFPMTSAVATAWCCSPMKLFEYAAAKRPLIATVPGAVNELLNDSNAYVIHEQSGLMVSDAIGEIKSNPDAARSRSIKLYQLARNWDWKIRAEIIANMYD